MPEDARAYRVIYEYEFTLDYGPRKGDRKIFTHCQGPYVNIGSAKSRRKYLVMQHRQYRDVVILRDEIQESGPWTVV